VYCTKQAEWFNQNGAGERPNNHDYPVNAAQMWMIYERRGGRLAESEQSFHEPTRIFLLIRAIRILLQWI
jgi:hypothetical protein